MTSYKISISDKDPFVPGELNRITFNNIDYRLLIDLADLCEEQGLFLTIDYSKEE